MPRSLLDATDDEILGALARYNWPNGRGKFWSPEHEQNYRRGLAEARTILGGAPVPTPLPFIPDAPVDRQPNGWGCALESTQWLLRSIGRNPDANDTLNDPWLRSQLVPGIISESNGLNNASGKPLAAWITREYGAEMGFTAHAVDVTYDDVLAGAGVNPTLIGGRRWGQGGHWSGVRRADEQGRLELANPSPGYDNVGTHLDRAEWDSRGPWSAVWIDRTSTQAPTPEPPVEDPRVTRARALIQQALAVLDEPA